VNHGPQANQPDTNPSSIPVITVVGLGPGDPSLITAGALEKIRTASHCILRTRVHPSASLLPEVESFDHLYETGDTFSEIYEAIVAELFRRAKQDAEIVYVVPGSPAVAEHTVELLLNGSAAFGVAVVVLPALSFADLAWACLRLDPLATPVTIIDAHRFVQDIQGRRGPFLVAQCHSNSVLSDVKLVLSESVPNPDDLAPVTVLHHLGLPDEQIIRVHWSLLDQSVEADHLTSLFVEELPHSVGLAADQLWELMTRLRIECPWNAEQTSISLAPYAVEEAYELVEAVSMLPVVNDDAVNDYAVNDDAVNDDAVNEIASHDPSPASVKHYAQELGDVLYQVLFHSAVAHDQGWFSFVDVINGLHAKLVYRHPHVFPRDDFDPGVIATSQDVERNWELIKAIERANRKL
jgi:tetrapyrrole methylase family protein / MazG family protein